MSMRFRAATFAILFFCVSSSFSIANADLHGDQKAVLVTGATSGIGSRIAEELAANGYFVYAGARKQEDMDRLDKMDNVEAIRLDVTVGGLDL